MYTLVYTRVFFNSYQLFFRSTIAAGKFASLRDAVQRFPIHVTMYVYVNARAYTHTYIDETSIKTKLSLFSRIDRILNRNLPIFLAQYELYGRITLTDVEKLPRFLAGDTISQRKWRFSRKISAHVTMFPCYNVSISLRVPLDRASPPRSFSSATIQIDHLVASSSFSFSVCMLVKEIASVALSSISPKNPRPLDLPSESTAIITGRLFARGVANRVNFPWRFTGDGPLHVALRGHPHAETQPSVRPSVRSCSALLEFSINNRHRQNFTREKPPGWVG